MEETKMQLVDWLDDLCVRFIINLPQEELESVERICFQVEEAQWFYEDFIRPLDPALPSLPLRTFCLRMFKHCPLLASFEEYQHIRAYEEFLAYKTRVPVRGAILLNETMDEAVLVRGWKKGASWSFPRGKINKDERDLDCAIREAYEETGFDVREAGLVTDEANMKFIEVTMREQHMKLYVFRGVPMDAHFAPRTRKEISKIQWYKLSTLPGWRKGKYQQPQGSENVLSANKVYMVAPFLQPLKSWISQQRRLESHHSHVRGHAAAISHGIMSEQEDYLTDERGHQAQSHGPRLCISDPLDLSAQSFQSQVDGTAHSHDHVQSSGGDAAGALKRLLSVGQSSTQSPVAPIHAQLRGMELLSLLQGNQMSIDQGLSRQPSHQYNHPGQAGSNLAHHTEGYNYQLQQRLDPHHTFFTTPQDQPQHIQAPQHLGLRNDNPYHSYTAGHGQRPENANVDQSIAHPSYSVNAPSHHEPAWRTIPIKQTPALSQRSGDPHFLKPDGELTQHATIIPSASDLPAPKLSNHAMNLLNVFKAPRDPSTAVPLKPDVATPKFSSDIEVPLSDETRSLPMHSPNPQNQASSDSRSRQSLAPASLQPIGPSIPVGKGSLASELSPVTKPSPRQNALLDLFRKSSTQFPQAASNLGIEEKAVVNLLEKPLSSTNVGIVEKDADRTEELLTVKDPFNSSTLFPDPIELSAVPSPAPGKRLFDHRDGKLKAHVPSPRVLARQQSPPVVEGEGGKPVASATVSGPIKVPDFNPTKRRVKQHLTEPEQAQLAKAQCTPIQILRRPVTPATSSPTLDVSPQRDEHVKVGEPSKKKTHHQSRVLAARSPPLAKPEILTTPKAFTPQILRRPKAEPDSREIEIKTASPVLIESVTKSTSSPLVGGSKQELLSLFGSSTKPTDTPFGPKQLKAIPHPSAEHKQSLLSLFGKPLEISAKSPQSVRSSTATIAPLSSEIIEKTAKPVETITNTKPTEQTFGVKAGAPNVGSPDFAISPIVTSPPAGESRRESQTPMSPSDKGFLLNFLQGFAKSTGSNQKK